ncbi:Telomerase reverse transcriptase [Gracilariopsis chorda]|uniref:Telomerase reverse transcriptase n=1 Tax=Gracilariopsis chorda TaxID=448386 RepID=A0A2V3IP09_9FLOR|nr:Telomerase reverse transcriptase [Gracilariopsis chorda]|eukprot:PXF43789.1 Telomerase reverse transcriptase [Gracilariopsis chorda]
MYLNSEKNAPVHSQGLCHVARRFFPSAILFEQYVEILNKSLSVKIEMRASSDPPSYNRLIDCLLVAFPFNPTFPANASAGVPLNGVTMDDLLAHVIGASLRKHNQRNSSLKPEQANILCMGFSLSEEDGPGSMFRDLDVRGPSASIQQLRTRAFRILLSRIGHVVMRYILMHGTFILRVDEKPRDSLSKGKRIYEEYPPSVFLQLCGPSSTPNDAIKRKQLSDGGKRLSATVGSEIVIKRDVLYRTPPSAHRFKNSWGPLQSHNPGLPSTHHLQRFKPSLKSAEHLIRIIFPSCHLQNNRGSVDDLLSCAESGTRRIHSYDITASNLMKTIKKKNKLRTIPHRLRTFIPISRDILRRTQKHSFRRLLGLFCPLPSRFRENDISSARLLSMYTNPRNVAKYLSACIQTAFPGDVFGSSRNRELVYKSVNHFVCKRNEKERFDVRRFLSRGGFKTCDVPWLHRRGANGHRTANPADLRYRTDRIFEFMTWLFRGFLIPIINQSFYVTEADRHRYRVFYYRREIWTFLHDRAEKQHYEDSQRFEIIPKDELNERCRQQISLTSATNWSKFSAFVYNDMRFVPKKASLRGIQRPRAKLLLLAKSDMKQVSVRELRRKKKAAYHAVMKDFVKILSSEAVKRESISGAGVFGLDGIYRKFLNMKNAWECEGCPRMFVSTVDIKTSFDTIPLKTLFEEVMPNLLSEDSYVLIKYKLSKPDFATGNVLHRFSTYVCTEPGEEASFCSVLKTKLARAHAGGLFLDLVWMTTWNKRSICDSLSKALRNNFVSVSRRRYNKSSSSGFAIQRHGLPQGHPVSQLLTSLFYGYVERHDLQDFLGPPGSGSVHKLPAYRKAEQLKVCADDIQKSVSLLMRLVDDTIYFTSSREKATQFLHRVTEESRSAAYGFSVNKDKTKTNFRTLASKAPQRFIPWCGILIDTKNLELRGDYARYKPVSDDRLRNAIRIDYDHDPCRRLAERAFSCFKPKLHPLLFDGRINSRSTVALNVYQSSLLSCLKLCSYVMEIKPENTSFLISVVEKTVSKFVYLLHRSVTSRRAKEHECHIPLSSLELRYICTHSYYTAIKKKLRPRRKMRKLADACISFLSSSMQRTHATLKSQKADNIISQLCDKMAAKDCNNLWDLRL